MPTASSTSSSTKYNIPLFLGLIAAGLAGNYFNYPIFLNIDFLFGSIFAMLALQFFGFGRAIVAAAIIASYTYILWNHPYAIIIMTAEVVTVGWLMGRRKTGMVLADTIFWTIIGMPLVYLFYHFIMHVPHSSCFITMTKQALNGIANALAARLIFTGYTLRSRSSQISYHEIIYNLLALFVLYPALLMLAIGSRADFRTTDRQIRFNLTQSSQRLGHYVKTWVVNRKTAIVNLAEMAASKSPQQLQPFLEQAKKSDTNFLRIGLLDKDATITAYFPLLDELGQKNIGKNFADRPFIPKLKQTLQPMLSEVVMGRIGTPKPIVTMLAPVAINGRYNGYVAGILNLEQIREQLDKSLSENATLYTLLDKNGTIIMTNRPDQKVMTHIDRGKGMFNRLDKNVRQWLPELPPNTPVSERWKKSFYIADTDIGDLAEWELILEQPVAPFQKALYGSYTGKLMLLLLVLLGSLALAELLSRRVVITLKQLSRLTQELPVKLASNNVDVAWPESAITEAQHLINNFKKMAELLIEQFLATRQINESLEQRVEERTAEVAQLTNQQRSIIESSPSPFALNDADLNITFLNEAFVKTIGYSRKDIPTVYEWWPKAYPDPDYRQMLTNKWNAHLKIAEQDGAEFEPIECRICCYDGTYRTFLVAAKRLSDSFRDTHLVTFLEITERKEYEERLTDAKEQAESANRAKSEFLANMSHEIRTPMNGVIGMTQLLEMTQLTEEQREYVAALKLSGKNLLSLINDILDLSKIEAGKIKLEMAEFSLQHSINDVVLTQKSLIHEKGLTLSVDIAADIPHVLVGDQLRIKQIIINLLGNAIKFTNHGNITISAQLLEQHDSSVLVQLAVCDSGIGISPESLDKIFKPFVQEDASTTRQFGGTGLGLSISMRLAELMGGTISVDSTQGSGSCFTVTVPFTFTRSAEIVLKTHTAATRTSKTPPLRVLFADDNPTNISFGTAVLRKLGHDVVSVENGRECLEALKQDRYDLVLMDIQMPVMNGEAALLDMRRQEQGGSRHQPVIAVTAYSLRGDKERFLQTGFDGYVAKPFAIMELVNEIQRVMIAPTDVVDAAREI